SVFLHSRFREFLNTYIFKEIQGLALREPSDLVGKQEYPGDMVMDPADNRASEARRADILLHSNKDSGLRSCFFGLRDVEVHLIPVKIRIIGRTHGRIKAECPSVHDLHTVGHDAHPVERRLPVEEDDVPIPYLSLHSPSRFELLGNRFKVSFSEPKPPFIRSYHIIGSAGMGKARPDWAIQYHLFQV